jgi:hypothetical protein
MLYNSLLHISDNTCAVAMASHLNSRSTAVAKVAADLREVLKSCDGQSFGVHLPGKLNVHTDRPSRAGNYKALFAMATPSPRILQWVKSLPQFRRARHVRWLSTLSASQASAQSVWVSFPPPHLRESAILTALELKRTYPSALFTLLLPQAAYADGRWTPLFSRLTRCARLPTTVPHFTKTTRVSNALWVHDLTLPYRLPGQWWLWLVS